MIKNPFLRAVGASVYIATLVLLMQYGLQDIEHQGNDVLAPITFLSLFVLSAATMGYFFVFYPLHLLIEHKPSDAAKSFLVMVAVFTGITSMFILVATSVL